MLGLLKQKYEEYETLKKIHIWIENEAQYHIGTLHIDNGKEYTSNDFDNYFCQHGIRHQTTIPYNPQQNGVVESMHKTLLNMVRSMLFLKNDNLMFWGDEF